MLLKFGLESIEILVLFVLYFVTLGGPKLNELEQNVNTKVKKTQQEF